MDEIDTELLRIEQKEERAKADSEMIEAMVGIHAKRNFSASDVSTMHLETVTHQYRGRIDVDKETGEVEKLPIIYKRM